MSSKYIKYTLTPAEFFNGQWQNVVQQLPSAQSILAACIQIKKAHFMTKHPQKMFHSTNDGP